MSNLKRILGVRDFWLNVPPKRVEMSRIGDRQLILDGLDNLRHCEAIGCLAGWIQTMPEFRQWYKETYGRSYKFTPTVDTIGLCYKYLEITNPGFRVFAGCTVEERAQYGNEWEAALSRLDKLIKDANMEVSDHDDSTH